jgi:HEAT repeat protein
MASLHGLTHPGSDDRDGPAADRPAADRAAADRAAADRAAADVLALLVDADPAVRLRAVLGLADLAEWLQILAGRLGVEPDPCVREAICARLAGHDVPEVVDGLIEYLSSEDLGLRSAVVQVLARTSTSTARRVPQLLVDPDPDVRLRTVMRLPALGSAQSEGWLNQVVAADAQPDVVAAAIGELARIAGIGCEPALCLACERFPRDPFITFAVTRALSALDRERR